MTQFFAWIASLNCVMLAALQVGPCCPPSPPYPGPTLAPCCNISHCFRNGRFRPSCFRPRPPVTLLQQVLNIFLHDPETV